MNVGRVVHCKREQFDVYIGRPSAFGNPYSHKDGTRAQFKVASRDEAVEAYRRWLWKKMESDAAFKQDVATLAGKTLGCWCAPQRCHGDVLAQAAVWAAGEDHDPGDEPGSDPSNEKEDDMLDLDPHDIWNPSEFRFILERALTKALTEDQLGRESSERRRRREAQRRYAAQLAPLAEEHRLAPTPSIPATEDYFSAAPKCLGEDDDLSPDAERDEWQTVSDAKLVAAAIEQGEDPIEALRRRVYMERKRALLPSQREAWDSKAEWGLALSAARDRFEASQEVVWRTQDELVEDDSAVAYLHRDEARAPRGFGMTTTEMRRKWLMDARHVYSDKLRAALAKHRGRISVEQAKQFPALASETQFARSVLAKWRFTDELVRHGVWNPDAATLDRLKKQLCEEVGCRVNYHNAAMELEWRTKLAQRGQYDRELNSLV